MGRPDGSSIRRDVHLVALLLGIFILAGEQAAESAWNHFRGPNGQGHAESTDLPLKWGTSENQIWFAELPGQGWSSPVVHDRRIYVTTAIPQGEGEELTYSLSLLVLDAETGKLLQTVPIFAQSNAKAPAIHSKNSHASPTPVIDGERIFVHFGHQGTACLDLNGKILWQNQSIQYPPVHGNGGSPIVVDGKLFFSCDGGEQPFVIALDCATGETVWKTPRVTDAQKTFSFSTPLAIQVNGQTQILSPGSNVVVAYHPDHGQEIWRVRYEGYSVVPRPVFGLGLVFISTSFDAPQVLAIRPDGQGDVTDTHVAWSQKRGAPNTPSLLLDGDYLFMVSDRGIASCLQAMTGEIVWQERLGGDYSASPLLAGKRIYFTSEEGTTHVVAASNQFEELAKNPLEERCLASLGVYGNDLLIRTEKGLHRIGTGR